MSSSSIDWPSLRTQSITHGFPRTRHIIWPLLLNAHSTPNPTPQSTDTPHPDEHQIELDTQRSFVLYPSANDKDLLQSQLHSLILSLFRTHPKLSYFQGYHDIVTVLLLTLPKELHFACLQKLTLHRLRDSMSSGLEPVIGLLRVTQNLIRSADPELASILDQCSTLPFFALPNLLTLFSHDMPTLPLIQHVFDYLLCRPPIAAVYLATTIILSRKDQVKRLHEEGEDGMIHSLLSSLPPLFDEPESDPSTADNGTRNGNDHIINNNGNNAVPLRETQAGTSTTPDTNDNDNDNNNKNATTPTFSFSLPPPKQDPDTDTDTDTDTDIGTDSTNLFSPPPESDLTLVDTTTDPFSKEDHSDGMTMTTENEKQEEKENTTTDPGRPEEEEKEANGTIQNPETVHTNTNTNTNTAHSTISLSSLLIQADELYALYPPTHPSLSLSSIMGPQSVVFTWSEDFAEWPDDAMAEAMVTRPDLVVYPHVVEPPPSPPASPVIKEGKPRRRRNGKGKMMGIGEVLGREKMVVGAVAVVAVGVVVALYGVKDHQHHVKSAFWPW